MSQFDRNGYPTNQPYSPPPAPTGYTPPPPVRPKRKSKAPVIFFLSSLALVVMIVCGGIVTGIGEEMSKPAPGTARAASGVTPTGTPPADQPTPETAKALTAKDVKLTVKTTRKQCFGSAGCNVTVSVKAGWPVDAVRSGDEYEVTYVITGDESGPLIDTLTINDDGTYEVRDKFLSTRRSSVKVKVRVESVEQVL